MDDFQEFLDMEMNKEIVRELRKKGVDIPEDFQLEFHPTKRMKKGMKSRFFYNTIYNGVTYEVEREYIQFVNSPTIRHYSVTPLVEAEEPRKEHARKCGEVARELNLPFPLVLVVGIEKSPLIKDYVDDFPKKIPHENRWELSTCGIDRRKRSIRFVMGDELYYSLGIHNMGQGNSSRVAEWLLSITEEEQ